MKKHAYTWGDLCHEWRHARRQKRSIGTDIERLVWISEHWRADLRLCSITATMVADLLRKKELEGVHRGRTQKITPASPATINRYWSLISAMLNLANERGWIGTPPKWRPYRKESIEHKFLTEDEARALLAELPHDLALLARFALATGLRKSNVTGLLWKQVEFAKRHMWVPAASAKGGKALSVPLNDDAMDVLGLCFCVAKGPRVFRYTGDPAGSAWHSACKRAGVEGLRFHDLRHSWASFHVKRGTPLPVLQRLGGWANIETVMIYAHLAPEHVASFANNGGVAMKPPHQNRGT